MDRATRAHSAALAEIRSLRGEIKALRLEAARHKTELAAMTADRMVSMTQTSQLQEQIVVMHEDVLATERARAEEVAERERGVAELATSLAVAQVCVPLF